MLYETKLDDSFLIVRFHMNGMENQSYLRQIKIGRCNTFDKDIPEIPVTFSDFDSDFVPLISTYTPLKASEDMRFFNVFRRYRKRSQA